MRDMNSPFHDALLRRRLSAALLVSAAMHAVLLAFLAGARQSGPASAGRPAFVVSLALPQQNAPEALPEALRQEASLAPATPIPATPASQPAGQRSAAQAGLLSELEHYYRGSEVEQRAEPLSLPDVQYPESPLAQGIEGRVMLRLLIDRDGVLREASVITATPAGLFDEVALQAVRMLRFRPALRGGLPVGSIKLIEVPFHPDCRRTGSCVNNAVPH